MAVPQQFSPATYLDLHISCKDVRNTDVGSKSDPFAVVFLRNSLQEEWKEVGRTEVIENNLNPSFVKAIRIQYFFQVTQFVRFVIYDSDDGEKSKEKKSDYLGALESPLGSILACTSGTFTQPLQYLLNPKIKAGSITVVAQEVRDSNYQVNFALAGRNLDKKDVFGKSDPYIIIKQKVGAGLVPVHQTETIMNTLNPEWNMISLNLQKLCESDMDRPIIFDCYDWDKHGEHDQIGIVETTMNQLLQLATQGPVELPFINPKKAGKRGYKNSGTLFFRQVNLTPVPSFLDYIRGGCEVNMVVAIDFTASNGIPSNKFSLHHVEPGVPNQYEMAIMSVGTILSYYDRDGMIPVYGYGGTLPDGSVSHCFALNGNPSNPEVPGVQGILDVYHMAIDNIGLSGPTNFAKIIHQTCDIIRMQQSPTHQKYFVLLIITDGAITDINETIQEIVKASNELPLSIVIVGVGNSPEFAKMEVLDADEHALTDSHGNKAARDIVQFVPFSNYAAFPPKLAEETLAEIPHQLVSYMRSHDIVPLIPPTPVAVDGVSPMAAAAYLPPH